MTIRTLIADDHLVFRSGLRALLQREADIEIVGDAGSADEVLAQLERTPADVLVLDLSMPGGLSGSQLAESVLRRHPRTRIVVLTMHEDPYYLKEMFRVGVHGYVLKRSGAEDVVRAIRAASKSEFHVDASLGGSAMSAMVAPAARPSQGRLGLLTPREREVCRLLALGFTNADAGKKLFISERTIESHRTSIMAKLNLKNRAELVRFALDNDLVR
ncbi:MAG: response regulator transcription factor [Deltaproteobacteria bacterium]|nr:response regulator transcription factor [Deltaproteobacteria bacterium]